MLRLYRWLLRLVPNPLRREYGPAMEETFARRLSDAKATGTRRRTQVCARELAGALVFGLSERWGAPAHARRRRDAIGSADPFGRKAGAMDGLGREIRHAARRLLRAPAFTLATISTLALAMGANAAIFTVVHRVVLNPLPYPDSARLVSLEYALPARNITSGFTSMTWQLYFQLADRARNLESVAVYDSGEATLTGSGEPERLRVTFATPSLASVLRVPPALGRWFAEDEGLPGSARAVVLSHGLWVRRYGGDADVLGRSITIEGLPATVIGVMPASFAFPDARVEAWLPAQSTRAEASFLFSLAGVARLREHETIARARAEITGLIADLARVAPNQDGIISAAIPLQEALVGRVAAALWILLASVGLVLLVACANVANLFLVRAEARYREVAVRRALGAGGGGIARLFLAESAWLTLAGGALGLAVAWAGVRLLVAFGPRSLPRLQEIQLDGVVVLFALALGVATTLVLGVIPLWRHAPLTSALHESGRGSTTGRSRHRARHLLMGGQVALALLLLVSSGLMVRSFQKLRAIDPGFDPSSTLTFRLGLPSRTYPTRAAGVAAHQAILDRLSAVPGVTAASTSTCLPLGTGCYGNPLRVEGRVVDENTVRPWVLFRAVAGGYVETMGMRVIRGRSIERGDVARREPVLVINQALADAYFPGEDPIGQRIKTSTRAPDWLTIVGIVSNTPTMALAESEPMAQMYMPMSIAGGPDIPREALIGPDVTMMNYVVRTAASPLLAVPAVRAAITEADRNLALADVRTLQDILDQSAAQMAFTMVLLTIAAGAALLMGLIGIYGVIAYIVSQRTGEIGVRLALGAEPRGVALLIVWQGALVTLAGLAVGLAAALAGSRVMESLLFGVSPRDPIVFSATTALLVVVAVLACWFPARRAALVSPVTALRAD